MPKMEIIPPLILLLPLLVGALFTGLDYPLTWDEPAYYSVLVIFGDSYLPSIEELKNYSRFDATPLSAILFGLWGKIFGFELWKLRLMSLLFNFGAVVAFYKIADLFLKKYNSKVNPLPLSLLLVFNPYFYVTSFLIFSDPSAVFFFMLSVFYYVKGRPLVSGFLAGLAILSRQFYLFFPLSVLLYLLIKKEFYKDENFFGAIMSLAMFFPFFYLWGWHLSPAYPQSTLGLPGVPNLSNLNYHLAIIAFYSLPVLTLLPVRTLLENKLIPLLLAPIFLISPPLFDIPHGILYFTLDAFFGAYKLVPLFLLWYLGILILAYLLKLTYHKGDEVFPTGIIIFSLMMLIFSWVSDKYFLAVLPLLFFLLAKDIKEPRAHALLFWIFVLALSAGLYSYLLFFKLINQMP